MNSNVERKLTEVLDVGDARAHDNSSRPTRHMRVAIVDFVLDPKQPGTSGLSDIVWNMAREMAKLGDDVHIFAPYAVDPPPVANITVHRFPLPWPGYRNVLGHIRIVLRAWQSVRKFPTFDFIYAPEYLSTGIISVLSSTPVVLTTPGNIYERIANGNPYDWTMTIALKFAARSSARRCAMINAISEDMKMWWVKTGAKPERVAVIPHGVDVARFRPIEGARESLSLGKSGTRFLYVGRLSPEKQVDMLLRAMAKLDRKMDFRLDILGTGPEDANLRALATELELTDLVAFHGQQPSDTLPTWYSAADAVVLPSRSEGLPRVMLEALASGTVFIGTDISGVRDHINDRENGFIVSLDDPDELAQQLIMVLEHPERMREIGQRSRAYAIRTFTWTSVVQEFRAAVSQTIGADVVTETTLRIAP